MPVDYQPDVDLELAGEQRCAPLMDSDEADGSAGIL
jgi:hypothetical protein